MTTYLTRIRLPYLDAATLGATDSYAWHQRLWHCFPDCNGRRDYLTRIDHQDDAVQILIVSPSLPTRPAWCPLDAWGCKEISSKFLNHDDYRFSLVANPTKKMRVVLSSGERAKQGRRVPLVQPEDRVEWINRKADAGGFNVYPDSLQVVPRGAERFERKGTTGQHTGCEFRGLLSVTNRQAFTETFRRGIGTAKGFGYGLLVLLPVG